MTITIEGHTPTPITIRRGSPQGSVLGCLLYCVTTQHLTRDLDPERRPGEACGGLPRSSNSVGVREVGVSLPRIGAGRGVNYFPQDDSSDDGIEFWDCNDDGEAPRASNKAEDHRVRGAFDGVPQMISFKYIDDTTIFAPANLDEATMHLTTDRTVQKFEGLCLGPVLECLSKRSEVIGMKINTKKTQLLVIIPPNGCNTTAVITVGESSIEACPTMKLLGFHFGESPGMEAHVVQLSHKFRRKIWMIFHLREAGLKGPRLFQMYCCYVRAVLEYCSPVYHSMLTKGQELTLERMHRLAVRICFGFDQDVEVIIRDRGIETLRERCVRRCDTFIRKSHVNPRFRTTWFPSRGADEAGLRNRRHIIKTRATTNRYFNAPLSFMRRRANELRLGAENE